MLSCVFISIILAQYVLLTRCVIASRLKDLQVLSQNLSDHVYLFLVALLIFKVGRNNLSGHVYLFLVVLLLFQVGRNNLNDHVYLFLVVLLLFEVGRNNLSDHVYLFLVVLLIFKVGRNNLSDHVYLFFVVLLIFKVLRNNLSGHVYVFHVVMTCYTSTCQHKTTRPCKHYRNIRGVHRRFRIFLVKSDNLKIKLIEFFRILIRNAIAAFEVAASHVFFCF